MDEVILEFYSDSNISNAYDELQLMSLDALRKEGDRITITLDDYQSLGDSIETIVKSNGGEILG